MDFKEWMFFAEANNLMNGFKGWYDYNRGNWSEVIAAAKQDPAIRNLIGQIDKNLTSLQQAGEWGNQLERAVERHFPNHSKPKARAAWERERFGLGPQQGDQQTRTKTAGSNDQSADMGFQLRQDKAHSPHDITTMVSDHERRLRNLEKFLQSSQSKVPVGNNDMTQSYVSTSTR